MAGIGRFIGKIGARTRLTKKRDPISGRRFARDQGIAPIRKFGSKNFELARPDVLNTTEANSLAKSIRNRGENARIIQVKGGFVVYESF